MFPQIRIRRDRALRLLAALVTTTELIADSATAQTSTTSPAISPRTKSDAPATNASFDPVGKSFIDFLWEAKRAFDAREYDRVIQLMDYALTLEINRSQAATATMNRGSAHALLEDTDLAIKDFDAALKFNPRFTEAYLNRGEALMKANELDEALKDFDQAIELDPQQWRPYEYRAQAFAAKREWREALRNLDKAIQVDPKASRAYASRAAIEIRYGEYKKAIADGDKAIALDRNAVTAYVARANAYIRLKQYPEAERNLQIIGELAPIDRTRKFNALAWLRATCNDPKVRNGKEAVELATKACETSRWKNWRNIDTLAAAYAEAGDFDSAIKYQERALAMTEDLPPSNMPEFRQRLALYQRHQAYRDELKP